MALSRLGSVECFTVCRSQLCGYRAKKGFAETKTIAAACSQVSKSWKEAFVERGQLQVPSLMINVSPVMTADPVRSVLRVLRRCHLVRSFTLRGRRPDLETTLARRS